MRSNIWNDMDIQIVFLTVDAFFGGVVIVVAGTVKKSIFFFKYDSFIMISVASNTMITCAH